LKIRYFISTFTLKEHVHYRDYNFALTFARARRRLRYIGEHSVSAAEGDKRGLPEELPVVEKTG
jgi:hypothetical protein